MGALLIMGVTAFLTWASVIEQSSPYKVLASQVNVSLQDQNLRTDLRWVGSRVTSSRKSQDDLRWVAKRGKTLVDLRTNLSSTKVNAIGWPNETQVENCLRRLASPFGQRFRVILAVALLDISNLISSLISVIFPGNISLYRYLVIPVPAIYWFHCTASAAIECWSHKQNQFSGLYTKVLPSGIAFEIAVEGFVSHTHFRFVAL